VFVTSWNWAYLTEFACFKPTYLLEDNPGDFSFFFDTSLRRVCYIAPERFLTSGEKFDFPIVHVYDLVTFVWVAY
jgi:phosphoinositide-3-kinase regulatory subunit 4